MKKYIVIIYQLLIVLLSLFGISVQIGFFNGNINLSVMNYFTLLSNLLCDIYFTLSIIYQVKHLKEDVTFNPFFEGLSLLSITVTMLVATILLRGQFPTTGLAGISFIILHYIVPIMTILNWLIFSKGSFKKNYPLLWSLSPVIYYLYVILLVCCGYSFSSTSKYPYAFQDVEVLGYGKVIGLDIILLVSFIGLGYLVYFIDKKLKKN